MAKVRGSVRAVCIFVLLLNFSHAVEDALKDPSLEIIRNEDAQEGLTPGYEDPNAIPCRDPTPVNGALEVVSGIPFRINSIVVKLKCLHGLVFPDGTTEKIEQCFGAPTPLRMTGIWSPDQEIFVCQEPKNNSQIISTDNTKSNKSGKRFLESLLCKVPKSPNNKIKVLNGHPNHLYSTIEVSCPAGTHLSNGQEAMNVTCLPLPDPCYCRASWETLDQNLLVSDFTCKASVPVTMNDPTPIVQMHTPDSKPVPCYDPTPTNGALEVLSGIPFMIDSVKVKVMCLNSLQFPDGTTEKNATCLPASTPYHVTGVWVPDFGPLRCEEKPKRTHIPKRFLETLVCMDPKTPNNTVENLDGDPFHMSSKVQVSCQEGGHFPNGLESVNVTCLPLPHPCMCMAAWQREDNYQLMYNFNCTVPSLKPEPVNPVLVKEEPGDTSHKEDTKNLDESSIIPKETKQSTGHIDNINNDIHDPNYNVISSNNIRNIKPDIEIVGSDNEVYNTDTQISKETETIKSNKVKNNEIYESSQNEVNDKTISAEEKSNYETLHEISVNKEDEEIIEDKEDEQHSEKVEIKPIPQSFISEEVEQQTGEEDIEQNESEDGAESDNIVNNGMEETVEEENEETFPAYESNEHVNIVDQTVKELPIELAEEDKEEEEAKISDLAEEVEYEPYESTESSVYVSENNEKSEEKEEFNNEHSEEQETEVEHQLEGENVEESTEKNVEETEEENVGEMDEEENVKESPEEEEKVGETEDEENVGDTEDEENVEEIEEGNVNESYEEEENVEEIEDGNANESHEVEENVEEIEDGNANESHEEEENVEESHEEENVNESNEEDENAGESHEEENVEEPEEEEWESTETYHESDLVNEQPKYIQLDEIFPLKAPISVHDTLKETYTHPEEENFDEEGENELLEVEEQQKEVIEEEEEMHEEETNEFEEIEEESQHGQEVEEEEESDGDEQEESENNSFLYDGGESEDVEPPGPLFEVQTVPFEKMEEDVQPIENEDSPCSHRPESGTGRYIETRYYYNSTTKECDTFIYGGFGGNKNNFESVEECAKTCCPSNS